MDSAEIGVLIGGVLLIAFTLWFFFGKRDEDAPVTSDGKAVYECPMHPWITSTDATANCSLCGMKLVRRGDEGTKKQAMSEDAHGRAHH